MAPATSMRFAIVAACLALTLLAPSAGFAREPGIGPSIPPGVSLGQANAVPLTQGLRVASRSSYEDTNVLGPDSKATGLRNQVANETVLITWVPGFDLLNASYKTFVLVPFLDYTLTSEAPAPKATRGTFQQYGIANPLLQVIDLSWTLGDGFYVNTGFGVFLPIGQWNFNAAINTGAPFWTFEPSASFSYFKDGWTASLIGYLDINTTNPVTNYYSGEVLVLNATFMKLIRGFNVGPVGYWLKQVTGDANYGGPNVYGGLTAPPTEEMAVGATISTQFGNLSVQLMFTQDVYAQNSIYGSKGWLSLSYHFK
jgi:hypothetical protein